MLELKLFQDHSEDVAYNFTDFCIRSNFARLSDYPNMSAANHWHDDFEFTIILHGKMAYSINGKPYLLTEGQAIFVNSGHMHYVFSSNGDECEFICILLPPSLISAIPRIADHYVNPLKQDSSHPFFIFDPKITWQRQFIEHLKQLHQLCQKQSEGFELQIMSLFYTIAYQLYHHVKQDQTAHESFLEKGIGPLRQMISYIQQNYSAKVTLNDIAIAGNVCRGNCCKIFQKFLNQSPIGYLTEYRLEKSLFLLKTTNYTITEIALQCGFNSSSYFTETFRKELNCTPSDYRKKHKH